MEYGYLITVAANALLILGGLVKIQAYIHSEFSKVSNRLAVVETKVEFFNKRQDQKG